MDAIDKVFTTATLKDKEFCLPIKLGLELGKRLMNKYYKLTDDSEIPRLAICTSFLLGSSCNTNSLHSTPPQPQAPVFPANELAAEVAGRSCRYSALGP